MNRGFFIALATLIGFSVGTFAGSWMQRHQPVPAPPTGLMGEVRDMPLNTSLPTDPNAPRPSGQPLAEEALRQMKAEIDAFKKKVDPIKTEFRAQLEAVLTPVQRERLKAMSERPPQPAPAPGTPVSKDKPDPAKDRGYRMYDGLDSTITLVVIPFTLARLTEELALTPAQRDAVHKLLIQRREKFIALVDSTPPPSFNLGKIAPKTTPAETK
jgi:uncharacterized membrane protein